jgi:hypothetical protein
MDNAALSNARNAVIKLTGTITGDQIVTIPTGIEKTYIVQNGTTGAFTVEFKQAGGTGTTFSTTDKSIKILFADGTNINTVDLDTLSGEIATAQLENLAVTSGKLASFAVTSARLASYAVTTAKLATNAVTAIKITQSTITQSKLATGSVGADQLIATAVTAGTYTSATITVDADGRITGASSGTAGGGAYQPTRFTTGPSSGTHRAQPTANRLGVWMYAGGGGGVQSTGAGTGGGGGYGFYSKPITQPFSQPFSIGAQGNAPGGGAGATTFANVGTVNAGGGAPGPGNSPGAAGTQPGSNFSGAPRPFISGGNFGAGGASGNPNGGENPSSNPGAPGQAGALIVFENTGT